MFWLAQVVATQEAPPKTGNDKIDAVVSAVYYVGTVIGALVTVVGALVGYGHWKGREVPPATVPEVKATADELARVAEKQAVMAEKLASLAESHDVVTRQLERMDDALRDARERLARVEGRPAS